MKLTLESTAEIVEVDGVECRRWVGRTETGVECFAFIHRLAVAPGADARQFRAELQLMSRPKKSDQELGMPSLPISMRHIL